MSKSIVKVKGTMINVGILVFNDHDVEDRLDQALEEKVISKSAFYSGLPFIIDFNEINDLKLYDVAKKTVDRLSENDINIVGARCTDNQWPILERVGFYYRDISQSEREIIAQKTEKETPKEPKKIIDEEDAIEANLVINRNVRSGQQIYAKNRSVIIYGNISSGAEVIADGNILVVGTLKGKAIAGADGDSGAIIQAKKMEPELVSIAGVFLASEDLDDFEGVYGSSMICKMDSKTEEISFIG